MTLCSCLPSTGNWPFKLRQKKELIFFFFNSTTQWCKESVCFVCASLILNAFMFCFLLFSFKLQSLLTYMDAEILKLVVIKIKSYFFLSKVIDSVLQK